MMHAPTIVIINSSTPNPTYRSTVSTVPYIPKSIISTTVPPPCSAWSVAGTSPSAPRTTSCCSPRRSEKNNNNIQKTTILLTMNSPTSKSEQWASLQILWIRETQKSRITQSTLGKASYHRFRELWSHLMISTKWVSAQIWWFRETSNPLF